MSNQLVAEVGTYTTHNKRKGRKTMPSAGFETVIPAIKRLQTYATVIDLCYRVLENAFVS
jgi:hypothetical protein